LSTIKQARSEDITAVLVIAVFRDVTLCRLV